MRLTATQARAWPPPKGAAGPGGLEQKHAPQGSRAGAARPPTLGLLPSTVKRKRDLDRGTRKGQAHTQQGPEFENKRRVQEWLRTVWSGPVRSIMGSRSQQQ